jgi:hypothetical protein
MRRRLRRRVGLVAGKSWSVCSTKSPTRRNTDRAQPDVPQMSALPLAVRSSLVADSALQITSFQRFQYLSKTCNQRIAISTVRRAGTNVSHHPDRSSETLRAAQPAGCKATETKKAHSNLSFGLSALVSRRSRIRGWMRRRLRRGAGLRRWMRKSLSACSL